MCGICGKLSWNNPPDSKLILSMAQAMVHRGPDNQSAVSFDAISLGHDRLSIIDLSTSANQPMADNSGQYHIVFNGEIYNFKHLKKELEALGATFRTNSDTEVLLESYKQWDTGCIDRLNGMFAFALWDNHAQRLFLARDRMGKKPLYYYPLSDGGIVFASEIKALLIDSEIPRTISPRALFQYFSLNYILSSDCILDGVRKLPPAHWLKVDRSGMHLEKYWDLSCFFNDKRQFSHEIEAAEELSYLLQDAVQLRMISDVPLGTFLSGGVDSTAITAFMRNADTNSVVKSFSIGFREKGYSELEYSQLAASELGTEHKFQIVTPDFINDLGQIVRAADEPFGDTSMIPMWYLSRYARQYVTVALSGDGADEIMAGYTTYSADKLKNMMSWIPSGVFKFSDRFMRLLPADYGKVSLNFKARQFLQGAQHSAGKAHYMWRCVLESEKLRQLFPKHLQSEFDNYNPYDDFAAHERDVEQCHYIDRAMYVDIKTWLVDDILVKVDRMSMAHSLEARTPMLDYRLVEFAAALPVKFKLSGFTGKYLLRRILKGKVPERILKRKKAGFNAPVAHWVPLLKELILDQCDPLLPDFIRTLYRDHQDRRRDYSLPLFAIANYALWKEHVLGY